MASDSGLEEYETTEELPFCKICYTDVDLIDRRVCDCSGSMANICFDCLRSSILRSQNTPRDELGLPVCPDCHRSYRDCVEFEVDSNEWTFMEWLYIDSAVNGYHVLGIFSWPAFLLSVLAALYWLFPNTPETPQVRYILYGYFVLIFGFIGYIAQPLWLYDRYLVYQNRPQPEILDVSIRDSNQNAQNIESIESDRFDPFIESQNIDIDSELSNAIELRTLVLCRVCGQSKEFYYQEICDCPGPICCNCILPDVKCFADLRNSTVLRDGKKCEFCHKYYRDIDYVEVVTRIETESNRRNMLFGEVRVDIEPNEPDPNQNTGSTSSESTEYEYSPSESTWM